MRAALALYALRFGGWLMSRAKSCPVQVSIDIYDDPECFDALTLTRAYGFLNREDA